MVLDEIRPLLDVLPLAAVVVSADTRRVMYANARAIALAAVRVGAPAFGADGPAVERALAGEAVEGEALLVRGTGGRVMPTLASAVALRDAQGAVGAALVTLQPVDDAAEHRCGEEAVRESSERLRLAREASAVGLWERELPRGLGWWSPETERIFRLPPGGYDGTYESYLRRVHPDDRGTIDEVLARALDTGEYRAEYRILRADGTRGRVLSLGRFLRKGDGAPARLTGAMLDITERRDAEEQRAALLARAQTARVSAERALTMVERLLHVTDTALAHQTLDGLLHELLQRVRDVLECDSASVLLVDPRDAYLVPVASSGLQEEEDDTPMRIAIGQGFAGRVAADGEPIRVADLATVEVVRRSVRVSLRSAIGAPLRIDDRVIGVLHAGTRERREFTVPDLELLKRVAFRAAAAIERARLFDAEREARATAESANRAKDDFLAIVSHELRTPLTAMLGWARLLRSGRLTPPQVEQALEAMERNTRAQASIISDLLDISRITSGTLQLNEHRVDLGAVAAEAVESLMEQAETKGVTIELRIDAAGSLVSGDPARLRQVVVNVVSNAVKFTPGGGRVNVLLEPANGWARLVVADTGVGIAPELLPHVFERFRQGESPTTRTHGGLGLGLAIARELVEYHRGTIRAESGGVGRGARFVLELPASRPGHAADAREEPRELAEERPDLRGLRVLEVDDHPDTRVMVRSALEQYGAIVYTAGSADEAMTALAAHEVDLVVSDIAMPGGDGYELVERIRRARGRALPVVALTAYASPAEHEAIVRAGFHLHLRKPIEPVEFARCLKRVGRRALSTSQP